MDVLCTVHREDRYSVTIEPPLYELEDEEEQEIVDLLLGDVATPRGPEIITTPPPKITKKKMRYVNQRDDEPRKTPHWNPVGEAAFNALCT